MTQDRCYDPRTVTTMGNCDKDDPLRCALLPSVGLGIAAARGGQDRVHCHRHMAPFGAEDLNRPAPLCVALSVTIPHAAPPPWSRSPSHSDMAR